MSLWEIRRRCVREHTRAAKTKIVNVICYVIRCMR